MPAFVLRTLIAAAILGILMFLALAVAADQLPSPRVSYWTLVAALVGYFWGGQHERRKNWRIGEGWRIWSLPDGSGIVLSDLRGWDVVDIVIDDDAVADIRYYGERLDGNDKPSGTLRHLSSDSRVGSREAETA